MSSMIALTFTYMLALSSGGSRGPQYALVEGHSQDCKAIVYALNGAGGSKYRRFPWGEQNDDIIQLESGPSFDQFTEFGNISIRTKSVRVVRGRVLSNRPTRITSFLAAMEPHGAEYYPIDLGHIRRELKNTKVRRENIELFKCGACSVTELEGDALSISSDIVVVSGRPYQIYEGGKYASAFQITEQDSPTDPEIQTSCYFASGKYGARK